MSLDLGKCQREGGCRTLLMPTEIERCELDVADGKLLGRCALVSDCAFLFVYRALCLLGCSVGWRIATLSFYAHNPY